MDRLAEIAEYNSAFRNALTDEDFLAAGYTPEEISAYRGQVTAPSLTDQDRAAMLSQYGTMERPGSQYEAPQGGYADIYRDSFLARNRDQTPTSVGFAQDYMDFIPIIGDIMAAGELKQELDKEDPNYPLAAALGIGTVAGAIPVVGDPLARGITKVARSAFDSPVTADVIGTVRGIVDRDIDFLLGRGSPSMTQGVGADVVGRAPVTFDDVERAMSEAPPVQSVQAPQDLPPIEVTQAPRITPRDLEDARIIPTVADLTRTGGYYTGIDASRIDVPEPMYGGPGYPLLQSSIDNNLAWAVTGQHINTKKAGKGADLIAVTAMNPDSHRSNISFVNSLIKTTEAYVRDGRIPDTVLDQADQMIRAAAEGGDPALEGLSRFPGFRSPNIQEWVNNATYQQRARVADVISNKSMQDLGMPNVNRVIQETADQNYAGANPRDTLLFIEPDFSAPPVDLWAEGYPTHPSFRYGIRGRVFGALDQNISTFEMFPDFWGERNINSFGEGFNKGGRRAFDMTLPIQEVTGRQVEELERIMTMEAARGTNLSPIDTRILVNSLTDRWRPTTTSVKQGGASPQAFVDAINNNKYRPALTNYSPQEVKAGARSSDLVAYQLGDDDVFFAIDAKPDYSWAGVEMQPGDKALVGVVSNAPGSKGTAAPSVIAKALDEGVNILDAFAVPSQRFPDGYLPEYYGEFGFEEVGRVPFDKEMYVADHGEQAFEDLLDAWRSDGWDESMGMPPVIVMRWSGTDADRAATIAGIRGAGAPSNRAETVGIVATAKRPSGRVADPSIQEGATGIGRGDRGTVGNDNRAGLSSRAREGAEGILGLTPQQLRNRGIPEDQIQQLMELRNIGR